MLYDPKWQNETKADPYSLESLIAWLEKQPADGAYDYVDPFDCLLCKYFRASGLEFDSIATNKLYMTEKDILGTEFPWVFADIANEPGTHNFGAALERARAELRRLTPIHRLT